MESLAGEGTSSNGAAAATGAAAAQPPTTSTTDLTTAATDVATTSASSVATAADAAEEAGTPRATSPSTLTLGVHTLRLALLDALTTRLATLPQLGGLAAIPTLQVGVSCCP